MYSESPTSPSLIRIVLRGNVRTTPVAAMSRSVSDCSGAARVRWRSGIVVARQSRATCGVEFARRATPSFDASTRRSSITLPSLGSSPRRGTSTSPRSLVTSRIESTIASRERRVAAGRPRRAASSGRCLRDCRRRAARARSPDGAATIAATCAGCTNMPLTFVVWSARPIQPLMRRLVRPHGDAPGSTADRSPVPKRISG